MKNLVQSQFAMIQINITSTTSTNKLVCGALLNQTFTHKSHIMYSLNCSYYDKEFTTIDALIDDIMQSGMDPNYEITKDGKPTGEIAFDLMVL